MYFEFVFGIRKTGDGKVKVNTREAVRSVIFKNGLLLMVKTNKGDLKLPGGGVGSKESHEKALTREVREETGYSVIRVREKVGTVTERREDYIEKGALFEMVSHYYLCDVSEDQGLQDLDDYEEDLGFYPCWVSIDEAIENNEMVLATGEEGINRWVKRENAVLRKLKEILATDS
ncbi:MAG: NUDIX domain-containing protein [Clostridiaceae bacterium]|nr:NUDIX domain-containing protein [Clostridiaceae bacterium]